jgi:nicotinamide-nucleotide amidase
MLKKSEVKVQLLLTGNELMSGVTTDTNSSRFAKSLEKAGMAISRKVTVGDELDLLISEIKNLSKESDLLLVNGGLGPTLDDLSAEALSKAFDLPLQKHPIAFDHVKNWCERLNTKLNDANIKQSILPEGVDILENPIGSALGFYIEKNNCLILFTPGVPSELEAMLDVAVEPLLRKHFPNAKMANIERLHCFGIGEARFQQAVDDKLKDWPEEVELSFRAGAPTLEIKLTTYSEQHQEIKKRCKQNLYELFGDYIVCEGEDTLPSSLVKLLNDKKQKVTFAESCTGGKIASLLTEVAGASDVFEAGFVTYSNDIKNKIIQVKQETLEQFGAVSEQVAKEMLSGALKQSGADIGAAVSGIAGPAGGSEEKPVGTVCIAWGSRNSMQSTTLLMPRSRQMFQLMVAATALDLLRRDLLKIETPPNYFGRRIIQKGN